MESDRFHPASPQGIVPELSLWRVPSTQESIEDTIEYEVRPVSTYSPHTPIKLHIKNAHDEYVMLNKCEMYITLKLKINDTKPVTEQDWAKITPVNNMFHSLFRKVNLRINNSEVSDESTNYAYKAYFETLLGYSPEAKKLAAGTTVWGLPVERNSILVSHLSTDKATSTVRLGGPLHLDLAFQSKAILGGTDFFIELVPNALGFYINSDSTVSLDVVWEDAVLFIHKTRVTKPLERAHLMSLERTPARYPYTRTEVRSYTVSQGRTNAIIDNLVTGVLPRRVFIAAVNDKVFTTNPKSDPLKFVNANISQLALFIDGKQYPQTSYSPDFANKLVTREYRGLLKALNQDGNQANFDININDWTESPVFGFNLQPDIGSWAGEGDLVGKKKHGQILMQVKFASALTEAITFLAYLEYDSCMEINHFGEVQIN